MKNNDLNAYKARLLDTQDDLESISDDYDKLLSDYETLLAAIVLAMQLEDCKNLDEILLGIRKKALETIEKNHTDSFIKLFDFEGVTVKKLDETQKGPLE